MTARHNTLNILSTKPRLNTAETEALCHSFVTSDPSAQATDEHITTYLLNTSARPLTADELVGAAKALRAHMIPVLRPSRLEGKLILDTCGTGGSGLSAFNTSTIAGLILASAGQAVAKHGNRAASSSCGSADLLEALGITITLPPEALTDILDKTNFCFMFAPLHHPATKRVQQIRKKLGVRTIFNFLGPLLNPCSADAQLLGVSSTSMAKEMLRALLQLGSQRALVVAGEDGLDEITLCANTLAYELREGEIKEFVILPEDMGFKKVAPESIRGGTPKESAKIALSILENIPSPHTDIVILNAGAALYVSGHVSTIADGIQYAREILASKKPLETLQAIIKLCALK